MSDQIVNLSDEILMNKYVVAYFPFIFYRIKALFTSSDHPKLNRKHSEKASKRLFFIKATRFFQ